MKMKIKNNFKFLYDLLNSFLALIGRNRTDIKLSKAFWEAIDNGRIHALNGASRPSLTSIDPVPPGVISVSM